MLRDDALALLASSKLHKYRIFRQALETAAKSPLALAEANLPAPRRYAGTEDVEAQGSPLLSPMDENGAADEAGGGRGGGRARGRRGQAGEGGGQGGAQAAARGERGGEARGGGARRVAAGGGRRAARALLGVAVLPRARPRAARRLAVGPRPARARAGHAGAADGGDGGGVGRRGARSARRSALFSRAEV